MERGAAGNEALRNILGTAVGGRAIPNLPHLAGLEAWWRGYTQDIFLPTILHQRRQQETPFLLEQLLCYLSSPLPRVFSASTRGGRARSAEGPKPCKPRLACALHKRSVSRLLPRQKRFVLRQRLKILLTY